MVNVPCLNCKNRKLACHDSCLKFREYKKELELIKKNRSKEVKAYGVHQLSIERATRTKMAAL